MTPGEELLFCALGGSGEIGMNVNLYGTQGQWLMVDLGLTFADPDYPGIDLILPDLEFIEKQKDRLAGIVLTHGHEDHIGAIPYLAAELKTPLYATPFTAGLIAEKLEEEGLTGQVKLNVIARDASFEIGPFKLTYVALAHSIPEGQRAADRDAARPHLPYRRLEDRRDARARRAVEPRSARAGRRPGRARPRVRFDQRLPGFAVGLRGRSARGPSRRGCPRPRPSGGYDLRLQRRPAADDRPGRERDRVGGCAWPAARWTGSCASRRRPDTCRISPTSSVSTKPCACRARKC